MESQPYLARRAMLEDLDQLRQLWQVEQLSALELEKSFTDFQVIETEDGRVIAAVGFRVEGKQGLIANEAYEDFGLTTILRPLLWERMQNVARNRGLLRLWSQESAPFWREQGMEAATMQTLDQLPAGFDTGRPGWLTLKLKDEVLAGLTPEQEYALFQEAAKEGTDKLKRQARIMNAIALGLALVFFVVVVFFVILGLKFRAANSSGRLPVPAGQH